MAHQYINKTFLKNPVSTFAQLPPGSFVGETRLVISQNALYQWNGAQWINAGIAGTGTFRADGSVPAKGDWNLAAYKLLSLGQLTSAEDEGFDLLSDVLDGSNAKVLNVDTSNAIINAGARLLSISIQGVEKFAIDKDGNIVTGGGVGAGTINVTGTYSNIPSSPCDLETAISELNDAIDTVGGASVWDRTGTIISPKNAGDDLDMGTGNIILIGTVDGVDVSALSLSNLPIAASGNIDCGTQAITNVGNIDGRDVSVDGGVLDGILNWKNILIAGQNTVIPANKNDELTMIAGTNISIATDNITKSITLNLISALSNIASIQLDGTVDGGIIGFDGGLTKHIKSDANGDELTITGFNKHLFINQGLRIKRILINANYDVLANDYYIGVDTSASRNIRLMSAIRFSGKIIKVKDESGGAFTNNITVSTEGAETIDGIATYIIDADWGSAEFICNGTNWFAL